MSQKNPEQPDATPTPAPAEAHENRFEIDRRKFLGGVGGVAIGTLSGGLAGLLAKRAHAAEPPAQPAAAAPASTPPQPPMPPKKIPITGRERIEAAYRIRVEVAEWERSLGLPEHTTNGDEDRFPERIGNFSKTLPHNELGEVDKAAYQQFKDACSSGGYADLEAVPAAGQISYQNPAGGLAFTLEGPDSAAIAAPAPASVASQEWAGQMAETYWMALLRDVAFVDYPNHPLVKEACEDLSKFKANIGPRDPQTGGVTPHTLFRSNFPGTLDGPFVSQFLLAPYTIDGVVVQQKISTAAPGLDFLTSFPEWLEAQNGFPKKFPVDEPRDPTPRYVRCGRDLARLASQDSYLSQYFKALLVMNGLGIRPGGFNPYNKSRRQGGFATFGDAYTAELLGTAHVERNVMYLKWHVHRYLRPEQGGALVHNVMTKKRDWPLHADLIKSSSVLERVYDYNKRQNKKRLGVDEGTYLLPQLLPFGCPTHPSYIAAHSGIGGSAITMLKCCYDVSQPFPNPVQSNADGTELIPYVPGKDGPALTIEGELHKLAHNVALGRNMMGVHWRFDSENGLMVGEQVAARVLTAQRATFAEPFKGFKFESFSGKVVAT
ncbi:MAG TPA: phosphoesterase [Thermoanaerobaculia bacterium]